MFGLGKAWGAVKAGSIADAIGKGGNYLSQGREMAFGVMRDPLVRNTAAWALGGAALGGAASAGHNAITGDNASWAGTGALALGGLAALRGLPGSGLYTKLSSKTLPWLGNIENKVARSAYKYGTGTEAFKELLSKSTKAESTLLRRGANFSAQWAGGAASGAIVGAGAGAMYGAFSSNESMFSGAWKGALMGAAAGGAFRRYGGGFNKLNHKVNPVQRANRPAKSLPSTHSSQSTQQAATQGVNVATEQVKAKPHITVADFKKPQLQAAVNKSNAPKIVSSKPFIPSIPTMKGPVRPPSPSFNQVNAPNYKVGRGYNYRHPGAPSKVNKINLSQLNNPNVTTEHNINKNMRNFNGFNWNAIQAYS